MKRKLLNLFLILASAVLLQQGIAFSHLRFSMLGDYSRVVKNNDIDPSALFYMESTLALAAEKSVREKLR
jgi:hypothetical protein